MASSEESDVTVVSVQPEHRLLYEGTFGDIHLATSAQNSEIQQRIYIQTPINEAISHWYERLTALKHGNLLLPKPAHFPAQAGERTELQLSFPAHPHSLQDIFDDERLIARASIQERIKWLTQVAAALQYLHSVGICHGELSPAFVFIESFASDSKVFVIPSACISGNKVFIHTLAGSSCRGRERSPFVESNVLEGVAPPAQCNDIYSFSMLCWSVLSGISPYYGADDCSSGAVVGLDVLKSRSRPTLRVLQELGVPHDMIQLVSECWNIDIDKRPTACEVYARMQAIGAPVFLKVRVPSMPLELANTTSRAEGILGTPIPDDTTHITAETMTSTVLVRSNKVKMHHMCRNTDLARLPGYIRSLDLSGERLYGYKSLTSSGCKLITDLGLSQLKRLDALNMSGCTGITDDGLSRLVHLKTLQMRDCEHISDAGIRSLIDLHTLDMSGCTNITDVGLQHLCTLTTLNIRGCEQISDAAFGSLYDLQAINMGGCPRITDRTLEMLGQLETLDMSDCISITDEGLRHLTRLITLNISYCDQISDAALHHFTVLRSLNVSHCSLITNAGLQLLSQLQCLDISYCDGVSDEGLVGLMQLQALKASHCSAITSAGISKLKSLMRLDISGCTLVDDEAVDSLPLLSELCVSGCPRFRGSALRGLKRLAILDASDCENLVGDNVACLTGLRSLDLSRWQNVSDLHFSALIALEHLAISGCKSVSDAGIANLTTLCELDISECTGVTDEGLQKLKNLHTLDASGCINITDRSISRLTALRHLNISDCSKVSTLALVPLSNLISLNAWGCDIQRQSLSFLRNLISFTGEEGKLCAGTLAHDESTWEKLNASSESASAYGSSSELVAPASNKRSKEPTTIKRHLPEAHVSGSELYVITEDEECRSKNKILRRHSSVQSCIIQ